MLYLPSYVNCLANKRYLPTYKSLGRRKNAINARNIFSVLVLFGRHCGIQYDEIRKGTSHYLGRLSVNIGDKVIKKLPCGVDKNLDRTGSDRITD